MDHQTILYIITLIVSVYGACLFEYEKINKGSATKVFRAVQTTNMGVAIVAFVHLIGRVGWQHYDVRIAGHFLWPFQWYPLVVALVYLNYHLTRKVLGYTDEA